MFKEYLRKGDHAYKIFETKPIHIPLISFLNPLSPCLSLTHKAYFSPSLWVISDTLFYPDPNQLIVIPVQAVKPNLKAVIPEEHKNSLGCLLKTSESWAPLKTCWFLCTPTFEEKHCLTVPLLLQELMKFPPGPRKSSPSSSTLPGPS